MRRSALLLLVLASCGEPAAVRLTPTDRFAFPASVALTAGAGGSSALLVASGNYDLFYDGADGGTVISVNPAMYAAGGSAGWPGGELKKLGEGAHVGSFVGQLVVADETSCPGFVSATQPPEVLVATRFADEIWRLPLDADGHLGECTATGTSTTKGCVAPTSTKLHDPFALALACVPGGRRSAFVSYLRVNDLGLGYTGYLAEIDLAAPSAQARPVPVGYAPISGLAYDARADRIYALSQQFLAAPIFMLDLNDCPASQAGCASASMAAVDLWPSLAGLDLQSIALSNHQDGLGRRAYVTARVYDATLAQALQGRPAGDVSSVLLVLDLEEGLMGRPTLRVLNRVTIGMGASQVKVLPVRTQAGGPPLRDVVVATSAEGIISVYDDAQGEVVRVIPIDVATGAPEAGRSPFGLVAEPEPFLSPDGLGQVSRVYVAGLQQAAVGIVDVPLEVPALAKALRDPATGALVRIGGIK
jgi:hypothetical protein